MTDRLVNLKGKFQPKTTDKKLVASYKLRMTGAAIGLFGGTSVFIATILLTIFDFLAREKPHGSWLFLAVLPLWIFGAHCLDKAEEVENKFP